jgi:hypothetical protein
MPSKFGIGPLVLVQNENVENNKVSQYDNLTVVVPYSCFIETDVVF